MSLSQDTMKEQKTDPQQILCAFEEFEEVVIVENLFLEKSNLKYIPYHKNVINIDRPSLN